MVIKHYILIFRTKKRQGQKLLTTVKKEVNTWNANLHRLPLRLGTCMGFFIIVTLFRRAAIFCTIFMDLFDVSCHWAPVNIEHIGEIKISK